MSKVIVISNQKGGVGKTTTVINLSYELAKKKKKILIVDIDPQGNSTSGLNTSFDESKSLYHLLCDNIKPEEAIHATQYPNLDIIPGNQDLSGAQVEMTNEEDREAILKNALVKVKFNYDYILIDTPPSLGLLTVNAFTAADSIFIPIQCEYFALEGITQLFRTIKTIKSTYNPDIYIEGILLTMYDARTNLSKEVAESVVAHFKEHVYNTIIDRNVKISESPSHGKAIGDYMPLSNGSISYRKLSAEFLKKQKNG